MSLDVHPLLDTLARARRHTDATHAATMTLVVFVEDPRMNAWVRDRARAIGVKHPSRVIFLDGTLAEGTQRLERVPRGEWLDLGVSGSTPGAMLNALSLLALPEAPIMLAWIATGIANDARLDALISRAQTVVFSSSAISANEGPLREVVAFADRHADLALADIAYLRLWGWQEVLATFFDDANRNRDLASLRHVDITCGSDAEALYLVGWLGSRLAWKPFGAHAFHDRDGNVITVELHRDGEPRHLKRVVLSSETSSFCAEMRDEDEHAVALTVAGSAPSLARMVPVPAADVASLIERAILSRNDAVFRATLATTGALLHFRPTQ